MTDTDNTDKAPESAPQAATVVGDAPTSPAAQQPATGAHCVTDRPAPGGQSSTGEIIKLDDVDVYVSKPTDYPHAPSHLLLLLTGGTGIRSVNNQLQADKYAAEGFLVLMPDMFGGDDAPGATAFADDSSSLLEQIKMRAAEAAKSFSIDMWLARVTADKVMPILHKVIEKAREEYAESVRHGDGIYAAGYCVGARFVMLLAQEKERAAGDEESAKEKEGPYIKAGALAHAASVVPDDFKGLKAPLSFACVENDPLFPDEVRSAGEDMMSDASLEHEVQVYPGVPHGFAVVGEYQDQSIKDAQAQAYDQMLTWLQNH